MQIGHSRLVTVMSVFCAVLGLASCAGTSTPNHTFTPTSTFSDPRGTGAPASSGTVVATTGPNVRPGEKPPSFPKKLEVNAPFAVLEFARFWMKAVDWGYATTDSTLARSLYALSCTDCARFLKNIIDTTRQKHQHFRGGRISVTATDLKPTDGRAGATAIVDVTISQGALKVVDAAGIAVESTPPIQGRMLRTWVRWDGDNWVVVDWKRVVAK